MRAALDTTMEAVDGWDWGWLLRKKKLPTINDWLGGFLKYTATPNGFVWMDNPTIKLDDFGYPHGLETSIFCMIIMTLSCEALSKPRDSFPIRDRHFCVKMCDNALGSAMKDGAHRFWHGGLFIYFFFAADFVCFWGFLVLCCFSDFLLFGFSAFLLLCFSASLLTLLLCFSCFSAFLLFAFPASLLFCFSVFPASLLLYFRAFLLLLFYFFFSSAMCFCCLLPAPLLLCFLFLLSLCFSCSFALFCSVCILNETLERP